MSEICYKITKTTDYSVRDCKEYDVNLTMLPDGHMFGSEDIEGNNIFYTDTLENAIETLETSNCKDDYYNIVECEADGRGDVEETKTSYVFKKYGRILYPFGNEKLSLDNFKKQFCNKNIRYMKIH